MQLVNEAEWDMKNSADQGGLLSRGTFDVIGSIVQRFFPRLVNSSWL